MSQCYPSTWKLCGTCAYWNGNRTAEQFGNYAYVDSPMACGTCMNRNSGWYRQTMQANANSICRDYEKWAILK